MFSIQQIYVVLSTAQVSRIFMVIIYLCLPPPDFLSTHHSHILTTDTNHKNYNYTVSLYNFIRGCRGGGGAIPVNEVGGL